MSQSEVESLLAMVGGGADSGADSGSPRGEPGSAPTLIARHEFPQLSSFSADQLRKLRLHCEAFITSFAARLSAHLRMECTLQMTKLESVRFQPFVNALPNPTHLTLFKLDPMAGICLLDLPPRLALSIVDRELGGPALCEEDPRDLTQIEVRLATKTVNLLLGEWCNIWADTLQLRPLIIRHETSGRFLQTSPPESMLLSVGIETKISQCVDLIQIAFPQSIVDPLIQKLSADLQSVEKSAAAIPQQPVRWNPAFNVVPIHLTARWHAMDMTARELAALKPGDVVPLRQDGSSQVELSIDSTPRFAGVLGTSGRRLAVKIVQPL
jgi:flagellar motor switch protein FliM